MADEQIMRDLGDGVKIFGMPQENPMILDQVAYTHVEYVQFFISLTDVRFAFGDRLPPEGKVKPWAGITMSHQFAKTFLASMPQVQQALEKVIAAGNELTKQQESPKAQS